MDTIHCRHNNITFTASSELLDTDELQLDTEPLDTGLQDYRTARHRPARHSLPATKHSYQLPRSTSNC